MLLVLAARPIDFAIFGTLGGLWLAGGVGIYFLYRWIRRYEGLQAPPPPAARAERLVAERPATAGSTLSRSPA